MASPQPPSLFSRISNRVPVLCLQLSSTPRLFMLQDQAPGSTSLPSFVSDALFSPAPYFQRTEALTHSAPLREGLTQQWLNIGCTQERFAGPCCCRCPETVARCQPAPENVHKIV